MRKLLFFLFFAPIGFFAQTDTELYYNIKETIKSHQLNYENTFRFMSDKCGTQNAESINILLKPTLDGYNRATEIFNTLNKNKLDLDKANLIGDIIQKTYNDLNYKVKYGEIKDFYGRYCIK